MSNIKEKTIGAANKIYRAIFKGSPNLFAATDLNRQIQLLTNRIDSVEKYLGVVSDLTRTTIYGGTLSEDVRLTFSYIEVFGMVIYNGSARSVEMNVPKSNGNAGVYLVIDLTETTFNNDPTHNISGVSFEGGEAPRPAANHLTYSAFSFVAEGTTAYNNAVSKANQGKALVIQMSKEVSDVWFTTFRMGSNNLPLQLNDFSRQLNRWAFAIVVIGLSNETSPAISFTLSKRSYNFPADSIRQTTGVTGFQFLKNGAPHKSYYTIMPETLRDTRSSQSSIQHILQVSTGVYETATNNYPQYAVYGSNIEVALDCRKTDDWGYASISFFKGRTINLFITTKV